MKGSTNNLTKLGGAGKESLNYSHGSLSAFRPIRVTNFDTNQPLDYITALDITRNKKVFYQILIKFINQQLEEGMKNISDGLDQSNFKKYKEHAHTVKGSSGYIGAGRIHFDCYFIQESWSKKEYEEMRSHYNRLVEDVIDFYLFVLEYLGSNEADRHYYSEFPITPFDPNRLTIANGYTIYSLKVHEDHNMPALPDCQGLKFLCLLAGQTPEERIKQRLTEPVRPDHLEDLDLYGKPIQGNQGSSKLKKDDGGEAEEKLSVKEGDQPQPSQTPPSIPASMARPSNSPEGDQKSGKQDSQHSHQTPSRAKNKLRFAGKAQIKGHTFQVTSPQQEPSKRELIRPEVPIPVPMPESVNQTPNFTQPVTTDPVPDPKQPSPQAQIQAAPVEQEPLVHLEPPPNSFPIQPVQDINAQIQPATLPSTMPPVPQLPVNPPPPMMHAAPQMMAPSTDMNNFPPPDNYAAYQQKPMMPQYQMPYHHQPPPFRENEDNRVYQQPPPNWAPPEQQPHLMEYSPMRPINQYPPMSGVNQFNYPPHYQHSQAEPPLRHERPQATQTSNQVKPQGIMSSRRSQKEHSDTFGESQNVNKSCCFGMNLSCFKDDQPNQQESGSCQIF